MEEHSLQYLSLILRHPSYQIYADDAKTFRVRTAAHLQNMMARLHVLFQ